MKLDLNKYTDKEIVTAFMQLNGMTLLRVMNAIGAVSEKMQRRGQLIAKQMSEDEIDDLIRKLGEGSE